MCTDILPPTSTCGTPSNPLTQTQKNILNAITVISRIAVVVLGLTAAPTLFCISLTLGTGYSYLNMKNNWFEYRKIEQHHVPKSCSTLSFEYLAAQKLPQAAALVVAMIDTLHHMEHVPYIFVPIAGFHLGLWAGASLWHVGRDITQETVASS